MQNTRTGFLSVWVHGLLLILILITIPVQVFALGPIDLSVNMTGVFPWNETGIMPGSRNSSFFELHNNGTEGGTLYVWLDDIRETNPHGSGTALGTYLQLNVSHPRLLTTISLPGNVYSFPSAPLLAKYIIINPFRSGETVRLNWTWEFKETGTPQNDAQDASLYFNISYTLVNVPPPPPPPPTPDPSDGGGGDSGSEGPIGQAVSGQQGPPQPGPPEQSGPPEPVEIQAAEVSGNYTIGFVGLVYNIDGRETLELNLDSATAAGAKVTIYPDHIVVYQHASPGVTITFWGDNLQIKNRMITGKIKKAEFVTDPLAANLTLGPVSGSIHAVLHTLIQRVSIENTIRGNVSTGIKEQFRVVAAKNNLLMEDVACTLNVQRFNLTKTGAADVILTLPESYVNQQGGPESIYIGRISEETGEAELLNTTYIGLDQNRTMTFRGESPNGTSLFGLLTTTGKPGKPEAPWEAPATGVVAGGAGWRGGLFNLLAENVLLFVLLMLATAGVAIYYWSEKHQN